MYDYDIKQYEAIHEKDQQAYEGGDAPKGKEEKYYQKDLDDFKADDKLKDGLVKERSCTDVLFLGLFLAFFVLMLIMTSMGYSSG